MNPIGQEILHIDTKLADLRKRWVLGSLAMKQYIEVGAKLLKDKRAKLVEKNAEKNNIDKTT